MSEETHSVGSVTGVIIPLSTILGGIYQFLLWLLLVLSCMRAVLGALRGSHMLYSPGIFPVMSRLVGKVCYRVIMCLKSAVVRRSCEGGMICTFWS